MTTTERTQRERCLVIDTNIFVLIVADHCLRKKNTADLDRVRILDAVQGTGLNAQSQHFDALRAMFWTAGRRIVTHHVVAESQGLQKSRPALSRIQDLFWITALELLERPGFEEVACGLEDLGQESAYKKLLVALGPCDAGVVMTAARHRATLLSDDAPLCSWAAQLGVRTRSLQHLAP